MGIEIRGAPVAKAIREQVAQDVLRWQQKAIHPRLAVVLASNDPASVEYARSKQKTALTLGIDLPLHDLGAAATQVELEGMLNELSADPKVHGILLEFPLAPGLDGEAALACIDPLKDVDGLTLTNLGRVAAGQEHSALTAATPQACIELAETQGPLAGKRVAVIGRGKTVGRPLLNMLVNRHATVTVCHSQTRDLAAAVRDCEIVFVAIGKAQAIGNEVLRAGQIVIDAGINVVGEKIVGDVAQSADSGLAAWTPVPGGVGPVTSAIIFRNLLRALTLQSKGG